MKKNLTLFLFAIAITVAATNCSQGGNAESEKTVLNEYSGDAYELFPTTNMWNFIKLNTRNGKMTMVQFSIEKDIDRMEVSLNDKSLTTMEANGRFTLVATQNIHNFILLDQVDGRTWQVQWGFEPDQCFVIPISQ